MTPRPFARRPTAPRCRGGASSLLRLSTAAASRWPSAAALSDWATLGNDATDNATAPMVAPSPDASSQWFTRLSPTSA
jgi:hypothetical protein